MFCLHDPFYFPGHFIEGIQQRNFRNRVDSTVALHSVSDRKAVEFYFASDAR